MLIVGHSRFTSSASMTSELTPRCLLTSARQRAVRMAASVCARVKWPRSEYIMLMSSSVDSSRHSFYRFLVEADAFGVR